MSFQHIPQPKPSQAQNPDNLPILPDCVHHALNSTYKGNKSSGTSQLPTQAIKHLHARNDELNWIVLTQPLGPTPTVPQQEHSKRHIEALNCLRDRRSYRGLPLISLIKNKYALPQRWRQTLKISAATVQGYSKRGPLCSHNQSSPNAAGPDRVQTGWSPGFMIIS